jgi:hypothetical protein
MGGKNMAQDVVNVQELLNMVPAAEGGPAPPLDVDGLCGPKTIAAIQKFQLAHFGWHGADGRVDPGGPTLAKLNEYESRSFGAPVAVTLRTAMSCPHGGAVLVTQARPTFVLTTSDRFTVSGCTFATPCVRVQWIGPPGRPLNTRSVGQCFNAFNVLQGTITFK